MPIIVNILISGGVLWALLIIFNESGNFKTVQQEAMLIIGLVIVAGVLVALILPTPGNLLAVVAQAVVLYFGAEKICDLTKPAAIRVTIWYFAIMFLIGCAFTLLGVLMSPAPVAEIYSRW